MAQANNQSCLPRAEIPPIDGEKDVNVIPQFRTKLSSQVARFFTSRSPVGIIPITEGCRAIDRGVFRESQGP